MSLINRLKLAKMIMKFGEVETDKGKLIYEGDLVEGVEVFTELDGELVPAENGEYQIEDKIYVVEDGKIAEIKEVEKEEEPAEEPIQQEETPEEGDKVAELEAKIAELEAQIEEKDAKIAELEAQLGEKEEQLAMSVAKPAHKEVKDIIISNKDNKALKYFK